ncbi:MAG: tRNA (N6-isopentenyl adenosine(37)-C2)-methylthiotransferase MiaB [Candidatus Marinimicrobia bacterium]|nr:tRNA (N6-isopentenyl adenosine(37)-C2)-methylthiotransferase MiaB [Candidatus Neomarinimicrobiota bacterium]MBL7059578.1 tRNA (N6-isopentenyl adenosine(37)-C2)-methylthiotransferase MiaB [Candidatus Neomarinimicrobiota bacterium]
MSVSYYIETYGCQMNVADSELIEGVLKEQGLILSHDINTADVIMVNTCAVRDHAEAKVHTRLGQFHKIKRQRPDVLIGVLGCMAQHLKNDLLENKPYVDIVLGPDSYRRLPEILRRKQEKKHIVDTKLSKYEVYDNLFPSRKEGINAWVSIMRGCDKFCTFCIVPFTRGRERSRRIESIVHEVTKAVADGFVEVTLLGQNVNSFKTGDKQFPDLLDSVAQVPGLQRIRYTSPHPQDVDSELLDVMAKHKNICNSIHLPLQAGSDRILKRMNRTYTKKHFMALADQIRNNLPGVGISTDIIVGFPGETEAEFQETLDVMHHVKFDSAFTFKYSSRPHTKAAEYTDHISEDVKQNRLERMITLQKEHTLFRNQEVVGSVLSVMVEKESKRSTDQWAGRTDSNKWVLFDKVNASVKEIVSVKINRAHGVSLHGSLVNKGVNDEVDKNI